MTKPDARHALHCEINAAKAVKANILSMIDDINDMDVIADTIEGETNLNELVETVIMSMDDDQTVVDGVAQRIAVLNERKARATKAIDAKRALVEQAMQIAERKTMALPIATATLREIPPGLVVNEEAEIPSEFFTTPKPTLDRRKLLEAIKERDAEIKFALEHNKKHPDNAIDLPKPIPGACLGNGSVSLTITRK